MPSPPDSPLETNGAVPLAEGTGPPWDKVKVGPPENWVEDEPYDSAVAAKEGAHVSYLLWVRQAHAESSTSFHATAARLETSIAVQNESQWKLALDPRFQEIALHWLRVVRDGIRIDQLRREGMRLLQRETQLERQVINGSWTLLVVLEDVRPGDVIESAYSYVNHNPISSAWTEHFFAVPSLFVVGRYRLSVLFDAGRTVMNSRSSAGAPVRAETAAPSGLTRWSWEGSQKIPLEPEGNQPSSFLDYLWIQVTDLGGWSTLARRLAEVWSSGVDLAELDAFDEFRRPEVVDAAAVTALVRHIQDGYRYLSVDLATGGWVPASPGKVARQRHGDCKDLAWLAASVLRRWGVSARPVLVGTGFRESVAALLPMAFLFNHVVLEVEVEQKRRWFDLTLRNQGGSYSSQPVHRFGYGLPVDDAAIDLQAQPGDICPSVYLVRETINLDTRKERPWFVEQRYWAEGFQAENLRRARLAKGTEGFSNERLKLTERRFGKAKRTVALQWRDDRSRNVCEVLEVFEVSNATGHAWDSKRVTYDLPPNTIVQNVGIPQGTHVRRGPFGLPYPLELAHEIAVLSTSMPAGNAWRRKWSSPELTLMVRAAHDKGRWSRTTRLVVNVSEISAARVDACREQLASFTRVTGWRLHIPVGYPLADAPGNFGIMPSQGCLSGAYVALDGADNYPEAMPGKDAAPDEFSPKNVRWRSFKASGSRISRTIGVAMIAIMLTSLLGLFTNIQAPTPPISKSAPNDFRLLPDNVSYPTATARVMQSTLSGRYSYTSASATCMIELRPDGSFIYSVNPGGTKVFGTWRSSGSDVDLIVGGKLDSKWTFSGADLIKHPENVWFRRVRDGDFIKSFELVPKS